ncbi:hypothetical protein NKR19_g10360, partial [Coniochaeta hoffmannii]
MRRLNIVLLAGLRLCGARQPSFSIHDDVLAYPQFEVIFSDSPIPESEALSLVDSANPTYSSDLSSETDLTSHVHSSPATPNSLDDSDTILSQTYTLLTLPPATYLCS